MFGTLRQDARNNDIEFRKREHHFTNPDSRWPGHSACDKCRAKKIRCSGQSSGCVRCKALAIPCTYSGSRKGKGPKAPRKDSLSIQEKKGEEGNTREHSRTGDTDIDSTEVANISNPTAVPPIDSPMENCTPQQQQAETSSAMDDDFDFMLSNEACEENISDTNHVLGIDWNSMMNDASAFDFLDSIVLPSQSLGFELESTLAIPDTDMMSTLHSVSETNTQLSPSPSTGVSLSLSAMELTTSSSKSTSNSTPMEKPQDLQGIANKGSQLACKCLETAVMLLDDLETRQSCQDGTSLDAALRSHKETMRSSQQMLNCRHFTSRPENLMILNLVSQKLVGLCDEIVDKCLRSATCGIGEGLQRSDLDTSEREEIFFGNYELDQPEWEEVIKTLTGMQLGGLDQLLKKLMAVNSTAQREAQVSKLQASKWKLEEITRKLYHC